ncbi:hypothetical protein CN918_29110 [Priestia megaterium]|nr:hypothetical protein CN918_29110 [Priestia megaterium]
MNPTKTYFDEKEIKQYKEWIDDNNVNDVYIDIAKKLNIPKLVVQFESIRNLHEYNNYLEVGMQEVRYLRVQHLKNALKSLLSDEEFERMSEFV